MNLAQAIPSGKHSRHFEIEQNHIHGEIINVISKMAVCLPERIAGISIYQKWCCTCV